jgi:hypothetical protein
MYRMSFTMIFGFLLSLTSSAEESVHHHEPHGQVQQKAAQPTEKFVPDKTLKERMSSILETMEALHQKDSKVAKEESLVDAGKKVESTVKDIFKNCKLEPRADAAIHPILASLLDGANLLNKGNSKDGHKKIHKALLEYEAHFIHKGWMHGRNE